MTIIQHFPCFMLFLFFFFFSRLLGCLRLGRGTTAPEGEREGGEDEGGGRKKKEVGSQTVFDMSPGRSGLSLLSVGCAAVRS